MRVNLGQPVAGAIERVTVDATVGGVALTVPAGALRAVIKCVDAAVTWRDDGTAPTASTGVQLDPGEWLEYEGNLFALKFIRVGASDGELHVAYYS